MQRVSKKQHHAVICASVTKSKHHPIMWWLSLPWLFLDLYFLRFMLLLLIILLFWCRLNHVQVAPQPQVIYLDYQRIYHQMWPSHGSEPTPESPVTTTAAVVIAKPAPPVVSSQPHVVSTELVATHDVEPAQLTAATINTMIANWFNQMIADRSLNGTTTNPQQPSSTTAPAQPSQSAQPITYVYVSPSENTTIVADTNPATLNVQGAATFGTDISVAGNIVTTGTIGSPTLANLNGVVYADANGNLSSTATPGTGTQCLVSNNGSAPTFSACNANATATWSGLSNATANLQLNQGAFTTAINYGSATGNANLFSLSDSANNTGSGYVLNVSTASGSTEQPLNIVAQGTPALSVDAQGVTTIATLKTINGLAVTPTVNSHLTLASGKTFSVNNTLSLSGTDGTNFTLPSASDTLVAENSTDVLTNKSLSGLQNTFSNIPNSATSAAATASANAIVMRDGSGNFSAGTITAALDGNAATATIAGNISGVVAVANGGSGSNTATGSGSLVLSNSPVFVTPTLGNATASLVNGLQITPTINAALTLGNGKTFSVSNSLALTGTDGTAFIFPSASDTLVGRASADVLSNKTISANVNTITGLSNANFSGSAGISNANLANPAVTITAGTGLSGGGATALGASAIINLANTGVVSGIYGSATQIPLITVDAQGRITSVSNVAISGAAPIGTASGDLTGSYPNPTIANGVVTAAKLAAGDYSSKITSGTYSININGSATTAGSATTVSNGVYTNAANTISANTNGAVPLTLKPLAITGTADVLDIYNNASVPSVAAYFDANGLFHGSGSGLTAIPNSALNNSSITVNAGTGLSGGGSVALGGALTLSLPQSISATATPTFAGLNLSGLNTNGGLAYTNGSGTLTTTLAPSAGQLLVGSVGGLPTFATLSGDATLSATGGLTIASGAITGSKIASGTITAANLSAGDYSSKITSGTYGVNISGNAATATSATSATTAGTVTNGVVTTGSYSNPSWLLSLDASKITSGTLGVARGGTGQVSFTSNGLVYGNGTGNLNVTAAPSAGQLLLGNSGGVPTFTTLSGDANVSANGLLTIGSGAVSGSKIASGTITATNLSAGDYSSVINSGTYGINISGNASTVTNGVYTNAANVIMASTTTAVPLSLKPLGSSATGHVLDIYNNLATPTISSYFDATGLFNGSGAGITSASIPISALVSGDYSSKITSGNYGINITGNAATATTATTAGTVTNGVVTTGSYSNPSWLLSIDASKLTTGTLAVARGGTGLSSLGGPNQILGINAAGTASEYKTLSVGSNLTLANGAGTIAVGLSATPTVTTLNGLTLNANTDGLTISGGTTSRSLTLSGGNISLNGGGNTLTLTGNATLNQDVSTTASPSFSGLTVNGALNLNNGLTFGSTATATNTLVTTATLANVAVSGTCVAAANAAGTAVFISTAMITTSQIYYNITRNRHSRISSVSTCVDASNNQWRVLTLSDTISSFVVADSIAVYNPTTDIGNSTNGFINNVYAIRVNAVAANLSGGFDVAEEYPTSDATITTGDVVSIDPENFGITKSIGRYDQTVIGVVSTNPALTLGDESSGIWKKVALSGRVPVNVNLENGPIHAGDYLTSSSVPGVAMRASKAGIIIGQALEGYSDTTTTSGQVLMFVKSGTFNGPSSASGVDSEITTDILHVSQIDASGGLTINDPVTITGGLQTDSISSIASALAIHGDVIFFGRPYFTTDTAGFATIHAGATDVVVTFDRPYLEQPIVDVSLSNNSDGQSDDQSQAFSDAIFAGNLQYIVAKKDENGFTIRLNHPATTDTPFSWIALAVHDAKTFNSVTVAPAQDSVVPSTDTTETIDDSDDQSTDTTAQQ